MAVIHARSRLVAAVGLAASLSACTVHKTEVPALTGPSGLGTNITIAVSPDVLTQDGLSQSLVTITALDSSGQPKANVQLRVTIVVGGAATDFGRLSARTLVTDANGHATLTYTAPPAPIIVVGPGTRVDIQVTPIDGNFDNSNSRVASILLVPPGIVIAGSALVADFTVSPGSPNAGDPATFTATVTDPTNSNQVPVSFTWDFGDGTTGSGQTLTHTFQRSGVNIVTLTITDNLGHIASVTHAVTVGAATTIAPIFFTTPASPAVAQSITFNASQTVPPAGHTITSFIWDFGDGSGDTGVVVSHAYTKAGTFTVLLRVVLDSGAQGTASQSLSVGTGAPSAVFTTSPASPIANQTINFNASGSTATTGRTITNYSWDFGDGTSTNTASAQTTHAYAVGGTYTVTLTVTDSAGQTGRAVQTITVAPDTPTASFTANPNPATVVAPATTASVSFDATSSTAASGRTIVRYDWTWGDGTSTSNGPVATSHAFAKGTFVVTLTVTDNAGKSATRSLTVVVN